MFIEINKKTFKIKKNNLFWAKFSKNKWEPLNLKIYKSLIVKNTNYYDIGSWIGPTVLIAANFFPKEIYAFEPDSIAYEELKNNIFMKKKKLKSEDFIKIDIEGGEYKLLPFIGPILRKRKPNIYLAPHPFLIDGYFNKIVMTNKLLFSLRGYKYIYQIKKNTLTSCRMINFLLKYRLPIFKKISRTLIFTNQKLLN